MPASLTQTLDVNAHTAEELEEESERIHRWLTAHPGHSPNRDQLYSTLGTIERNQAAPAPPSPPAYTLTLRYPPNHEEHLEQVSAEGAARGIRRFANQVESHIVGGEEGLKFLHGLHEDQWIVAGVSDVLGGVSLPPQNIWAGARGPLERARAALDRGEIEGAARHAQTAAQRTRSVEAEVYNYREGTISGAEHAEFGLQVVVVASATIVAVGTAGVAAGAGGATALGGLATGATAGGSAGLAGLAGGSVYGAVQQSVGQAEEVRLGLRSEIDWGGIGFDALFGVITGYLGGQVGGKFVQRFLANPATAAFGQRMAVTVLGDLVAGRTGSVLHRAARMVYDDLRGRENLTLESFVDHLIEQLFDPRGAFFDLILGAANRRLAGSATPHAAPEAAPSAPAPGHQTEVDMHWFEQTFDTALPAPEALAPGTGVVSQAPEVGAGFSPQHVGPLGRLLGQTMNATGLADVARVWNSVANPGEAATLTSANSRRLFNNQRNRFWRAVRGDAAARQVFTDAGFTFDSSPTTAPFYELPNGQRVQATVDHAIERQSDPGRALDSTNLRIVFRRENTVVLRLLNALSPF